MTLDYSRSIQSGAIGNGFHQDMMQAQAQKEAAYRGQVNAVACDTPTRGSESAIQQVTHRLQHLSELTLRLESLADRVCGCRPPSTSASNGKIAPSHDSLSGKLDLAIMAIETLNERLSDALSRLECFA